MTNKEYKFIKDFIDEVKDDIIYTDIFNILTSNDSIKNYTHNNNGIFFIFNKIADENISNTISYIHSYKTREKNKNDYENERQKFFQLELKDDNKNNLSKFLDNKSTNFSSTILSDDESSDTPESVVSIPNNLDDYNEEELFGVYNSDDE